MRWHPSHRVHRARALAAAILLPLASIGPQAAAAVPPQATPAAGWSWQLPPDFPEPRVPGDNPMSAAKVDLGRHLFYDRRLSGNGRMSCAGCHDQKRAFTDGRAVAVGSTGQRTARNAQHLGNVAWHATYTWANPALVSLESQMLVPLFGEDPVEMGVNDLNREAVLQRLRDDPATVVRFRRAFPGQEQPLHFANVARAIAAFQRTLVSADSRYDRWQRGELRLTAAEERGRDLFFGERAECFHCHAGFNFNDQVVHARSREVDTPFHNTGQYDLDGRGAYPAPNRGVFEITGNAEDMGAFRAPSLRNVAVTAPYMHDGSVPTLAAVLRNYAAGGRHTRNGPLAGDGRRNPFKSELIGRIDLSRRNRADLVAFLKTLTDTCFLARPGLGDPSREALAHRRAAAALASDCPARGGGSPP